ncbi:hypothetical protein Mp_2g26190 [Marchantia polymorpha subsp. ruderalis]|nr:hypothetical protein Mp_2g26190 [Marchantia polymorpha subsp. ruderalis]
MTGNRALFVDLDVSVDGTVSFGDNSVVDIKGRGTVLITVRGGEHRALTDVYFIPRLKTSIVSLGQLDENGYPSSIRDDYMSLWDRQDRLLANVTRSAYRLYKVVLQVAQPVCLSVRHGDGAWRWHERLGHQNFGALKTMARTGLLRGLPPIEHVEQVCDACLAGKQQRAPFLQVAKYRATETLELVHADLCGPISPATPGGKKFFLLMVDDHSCFMWVVLLVSKDGAAASIQRVVERRNQTVVGMARSMLKARNVPNRFWEEAVLTAVYVLNRSFTRSVDGMTPYEAWHG